MHWLEHNLEWTDMKTYNLNQLIYLILLLILNISFFGGIGLYMNSDKTVFMPISQDSAITSLNDKPLKLVKLD